VKGTKKTAQDAQEIHICGRCVILKEQTYEERKAKALKCLHIRQEKKGGGGGTKKEQGILSKKKVGNERAGGGSRGEKREG